MSAPARPRHFASDNWAGICPEALDALQEAGRDHAPAYGDDGWTTRACDLIRGVLETKCEVFFVFSGTAANAVSLAALTKPYNAILCHRLAHVEVDECGAPEFFSGGAKVIPLEGDHGKLTPAAIESVARRRTDLHFPRAGAVSLTQATEVGTVYTPDEVKAIGDRAKALGLSVYMDGARFANAVSTLGVAPKEITWQAGVDILGFGGSKNGTPMGEAVVVFDPALAREFEYRVKQAGQLASKMRFLAAPWVGALRDGAWLRHAAHANAMAARLEKAILGLGTVRILHPRQANAVFADIPAPAVDGMAKKGWHFHTFDAWGSRLMCAWDTTEGDVDGFAADLASLL